MSQYSMGNIKMWQLTWHLCHRKFTIGNHLNIANRECHIHWRRVYVLAMTKLLGCLLNKFQLLTLNIVCVWAQNVSCALYDAKTTFSKTWSIKDFHLFLHLLILYIFFQISFLRLEEGCYLFSTATPSNWYICWSCQFVLTNGWNFTPATSNLTIE